MQGLLAQQPAQTPTEQQANLDAQGMQKHIQNIVFAAQHIMYAPETRKHFIQDLMRKIAQYKDPAIAAAAEASDLMMLLMAESKFKMNSKAVVPAGIMLTGEVLSFISQATKTKVNEEDSHQAMTAFAKMIMQKTGAQNVGV